uniref:Uncharacterized protein n=1 Tax=Knipowitschia caucasica TaxID=637954 RepID=A0AAV2KYC5_KNICA
MEEGEGKVSSGCYHLRGVLGHAGGQCLESLERRQGPGPNITWAPGSRSADPTAGCGGEWGVYACSPPPSWAADPGLSLREGDT